MNMNIKYIPKEETVANWTALLQDAHSAIHDLNKYTPDNIPLSEYCKHYKCGVTARECVKFALEKPSRPTEDDALRVLFNISERAASLRKTRIFKTKVCTKCGRLLPLTEFYARSDRKDKLQSHCKYCQREHGRLRNGTTGGYKKQETPNLAVKSCSDADLVGELRSRGLLTVELAVTILRENGFTGTFGKHIEYSI